MYLINNNARMISSCVLNTLSRNPPPSTLSGNPSKIELGPENTIHPPLEQNSIEKYPVLC